MSRKNEIVAEEVAERKALWAAVRRAEPIQQVRRLMRQKKLLNKDLAERLGVTEAAVSRLLKGNQNIQIDTLYMLSDALEEPLNIGFGTQESVYTYTFDEETVSGFFESCEDISANCTNVVQLSSFRKYVSTPSKNNNISSELLLECA